MTIYVLLAFYFALGAIGMWLFARNKDEERKRALWTKYVFYLIIVFTMMLFLELPPLLYRSLAVLLAVIGFYEIYHISSPYKRIFLFSASIYFILSCLFLYTYCQHTHLYLQYCYFVILTFDGFSQVTGQLLGGPKLVPAISPNKTIAGVAGGSIAALLTCYFWQESYVLTTLLILSGLSGDLLASYLKRRVYVKDYSQLIPGHGGILDRFDSYIFALAILGLIQLISC